MMGERAIFHDTQTAQEVSTTGTHGPFSLAMGELLSAQTREWALGPSARDHASMPWRLRRAARESGERRGFVAKSIGLVLLTLPVLIESEEQTG